MHFYRNTFLIEYSSKYSCIQVLCQTMFDWIYASILMGIGVFSCFKSNININKCYVYQLLVVVFNVLKVRVCSKKCGFV